jgi:hypothetical protein
MHRTFGFLLALGLAAPTALADVSPKHPTPSDVVKVTAHFGGGGGCNIKETVTVGKPGADGKIEILVKREGVGACDLAFLPAVKTVSLGKLKAGSYVIKAGSEQFDLTVAKKSPAKKVPGHK